MAEPLETISNENIGDNLNDFELRSAYKQISIQFDGENFDYAEFESIIIKNIEECFDKNFLLESSEKIQKDVEIINMKFVHFLKYIVSVDVKKTTTYSINTGLIFVIFCDYFDLDSCIAYENLHKNIKSKIENSCKKLVGKDTFEKYKNKKTQRMIGNTNGEHVTIKSIFDI